MRYVGESPSAELLDDGVRAASLYTRGGRIGSELPIWRALRRAPLFRAQT